MAGIIVVTIFIFGCAFGAHVLAQRKGRSVKRWVLASLFFGPLSLLVLALMPRLSGPATTGQTA
jgi:integral membrane sensor domain MASE1